MGMLRQLHNHTAGARREAIAQRSLQMQEEKKEKKVRKGKRYRPKIRNPVKVISKNTLTGYDWRTPAPATPKFGARGSLNPKTFPSGRSPAHTWILKPIAPLSEFKSTERYMSPRAKTAARARGHFLRHKLLAYPS